MDIDTISDLDAGQVLAAVECWTSAQTRAEVSIFLAAARFADLHHPDSRGHERGPVLAGMERPVRLGGAGTPRVWEFACADFGPRVGRSPYAARMLMADALDVRHRLPRLWARVCAHEVPVRFARQVAQQTRELSAEAAGTVDAAVAGYADGRLSWGRFERLVAAKVVEADPERAAERERAAAEEEFARVSRGGEHGRKTLYVRSSAAAVVRIDATIAFLARALGELGDVDTLDRRRAKAVLVLAHPDKALQLLATYAAHRAGTGQADTAPLVDLDPAETRPGDEDQPDTGDDTAAGGGRIYGLPVDDPPDDAVDGGRPTRPAPADEPADEQPREGEQPPGGERDRLVGFFAPFRPCEITPDRRFGYGFDPKTLLPGVTVYLHLALDPVTGRPNGVARFEGQGPVSVGYVRDLLGPHAIFTVKPVIDPASMAPVDGYEVPDRMREALHLRTPADIFPFAAHVDRAGKQADHTCPYVPPDDGGPPGQTHLGNLGPMTTFHHRVKTHGRWQLAQPFPGIFVWRDPYGAVYLVDHTGTRRLTDTGPPTDVADTVIDIYPDPGDDLTYACRHAA